MNNTELTLDQLAEVAAAGLYINTNGSASYEQKLSSLLVESAGGDIFDLTQSVLDTKSYAQPALFEMEQGVAKNATDQLRSLAKKIG